MPLPGRSPDHTGLAGFDQECERAGELGRAQGVVGGDGVGNGHGQGSEWQGIGADALPGHPAFAPPAAPLPLSAKRGRYPEQQGAGGEKALGRSPPGRRAERRRRQGGRHGCGRARGWEVGRQDALAMTLRRGRPTVGRGLAGNGPVL